MIAGIRETGLYPLKSKVSCTLVGKAALIPFGQHAVHRILHSELQALAVFQFKRHKVVGVSR